MISMRQVMEHGVSEVLSCVVDDVSQAVNRKVSGAQLLHELLRAPWLHALLKMYESLLQFQRLTPSPSLPYASGLSHEIISVIQKLHRPSAEARELYSLLSSPHLQALLSSHDSVAQADYGPVLPPLPEELPEDEEAMRIVCLVKNNQPLTAVERRASVGVIRSQWSSLRRLTLERLVPARRAWSGEELRATEAQRVWSGEESTGSCCLCPTVEPWDKRLNQSAPSIFSHTACTGLLSEKPRPGAAEEASTGGSSDDYAYPPPPVPAYSLSLPNSPVLYKKQGMGGQSRTVPTPGRAPSCPGMSPVRAHTAPSTPAAQRSILPTPGRQTGPQNKHHKEPLSCSSMSYRSTSPRHNGRQNQPKHARNKHQQPKLFQHPQTPEFPKECSMEELRSTVQTVASSIEHGTRDVRHLGRKMVAATEMITDNVDENAQALNLLAEVVDKLQGLIVANKHPESSPPHRPKQHPPPPPPPRVSSISPKSIRKPPTPYPRRRSSSSSSSCSSTSASSCADGFLSPRSPKRMNGGCRRTAVAFGTSNRAGVSGSNGQVRFNNGSVPPLGDEQDRKSTGCLTAKKKKRNK